MTQGILGFAGVIVGAAISILGLWLTQRTASRAARLAHERQLLLNERERFHLREQSLFDEGRKHLEVAYATLGSIAYACSLAADVIRYETAFDTKAFDLWYADLVESIDRVSMAISLREQGPDDVWISHAQEKFMESVKDVGSAVGTLQRAVCEHFVEHGISALITVDDRRRALRQST